MFVDESGCFVLPAPSPVLPKSSDRPPSTKKPPKSTRQTTLSEYVERPTGVVSTLNEFYWVSEADFTQEHKDSLTVTPKRNTTFGPKPKDGEDLTFTIYRENNSQFGVPRFYGEQVWGVPTTNALSDGEPMSPTVMFNGELRDTDQKPQQSAFNAWVDQGHRGILCVYCGFGKTVVAIYAAIEKRRRTIILVHNSDLSDQWVERLRQYAPEARVGFLIQDRIDIEDKDFVIGMIQSVNSRDYEGLDTFGTLIVDEAHHIGARTFYNAVTKFRARYVMGLSATPKRADGLSNVIYWTVGPVFFEAARQDRTPLKVEQILYTDGSQKEIRFGSGPAFARMIKRIITDPRRNALIMYYVKYLIEDKQSRQIMIVSERVEHIEHLYDTLCKAGYDVGKYYGKLSKKQLEDSKKRQIICASYSMASEGLDISGLNGMILATPYGRSEQTVGRLREDENGTQRYLIDIVDPYSVFDGMSWKRHKLFKSLGYHVTRKEGGPPKMTFF